MMKHYWRFLFISLFTALLSACDGVPRAQFSALDITGAPGYGDDFRLIDHTGKLRTMADFRGEVVVMFFGFTHCPDVCPTTLSDMKQVMQLLDKDAARVQVLFVTLDPQRDNPERLAKYVTSFHPTFLGLYGDAPAIAKTTRDFKIYSQIQPGKTAESYTVDHTAASLVFDPQGRLRLFLTYGLGTEKIASDIRLLLKGNNL